ncbi:class I SAM-dependent methyltransferase [Anabaena catenula]|uniref:Class I SAM-dependent methyltransferase n=1 Tax=Anabaena catenula FACHB-362 TaxID=2692877 RepID=A0ABR8IYE9_9NOST|nr:class I SAM-dependent methyltransferase [Anabaena catenula]MBD2690199.1 class I SAM-dependent methyltransferase [Anabaena catenula FACHB-362]
MKNNSEEILKDYYSKKANDYDKLQLHENDEHHNALKLLLGLIINEDFRTVLDVGTGTGRALLYLKNFLPDINYRGIEFIPELREISISKGLSSEKIDLGDARELPYPNNSFELVTAFGVLHHVANPLLVIDEMLRVSSRAIYISDHNIYGWGSTITKTAKQLLRTAFGQKGSGLILTGFRGYYITDYDGVFYPFSLCDYLPKLQQHSNIEFLFSTKGHTTNLYTQASHLAVLATKKT